MLRFGSLCTNVAGAALEAIRHRPTVQLRSFAHWYCGTKRKFRYARDRRFHPSFLVSSNARNRQSSKLHFKTNRWNYVQGYRDMP